MKLNFTVTVERASTTFPQVGSGESPCVEGEST
jgi:hypothetical protein